MLASMGVSGRAFKEDRGGGEEDLIEATWSYCGETYALEASLNQKIDDFSCKIDGLGFSSDGAAQSPQSDLDRKVSCVLGPR